MVVPNAFADAELRSSVLVASSAVLTTTLALTGPVNAAWTAVAAAATLSVTVVVLVSSTAVLLLESSSVVVLETVGARARAPAGICLSRSIVALTLSARSETVSVRSLRLARAPS